MEFGDGKVLRGTEWEMTVRGKAKHREFSQFRGGRLSALHQGVNRLRWAGYREFMKMALNKDFLKKRSH